MGVYIPNMEKPKECKDCSFYMEFTMGVHHVGSLCTLAEAEYGKIEVDQNDCPLIEIDLVRCGECVWYKDFDGCFFSTDEVKPNDFCSYGERRTDER